jgi:ferredoxin
MARQHGAGRAARRGAGGWRAARQARRAVQILAFAVFVYLLFAGLQRLQPLPYANIFFRFDPLAGLATMLAARAWLSPFALTLITLGLTLLVGRFWCGWICPMGTLLGWLRLRRSRQPVRVPAELRRIKYVLLGAIVFLAAFGNLSLLVLDPVALLTRTMTTAVIPGFVFAVDELQRAGMTWGPTVGVVQWVEEALRGPVLPMSQPRYDQGLALFLVFVAIALLGLLADRFWCRYLCPLGALLGLVAKVQVLRPVASESCGACGACASACRVDAIETGGAGAPGRRPGGEEGGGGQVALSPRSARVVSSECTMCLDCLAACPQQGGMKLGVAAPGPWAEYDPGRREVVIAAAAGAGAALLLGSGLAGAAPRRAVVRPPGAQDEEAFLSRCLRCSECMKACPTSGLQPALLEAGLESLWTPVLKSRLGYCDFACAACGQVCPSGAIPPLSLERKRRQVIGLAVIDEDRCLPYAEDTPCIVCEEMCPVAEKAVVLEEVTVTREDGRRERLARPRVVASRCIGCGICEYKCPVDGRSAIVVVPPPGRPA